MTSSDNASSSSSSTTTVVLLVLLLACLIVLLIFLYKKLNRESEGQYTIRRMVYKEGGLRDRVRSAAMFVGGHLGVRLWPNGESEEDGEEMQDIEDGRGQVGEHSRQGSESKEGEQEEDEEEDEDEDEDEEEELCGERRGKQGDTSDGNCGSSEERVSLMDRLEIREEGEETGGDGDGKLEASGGAGLQINLSQFSGSANWSGAEGGISDVTAL